jgi:hypothetical protein
MKERDMQQALAAALSGSPLWPPGAAVIVARPGDIATEILTSVRKGGLCAIIGEPDNIEGYPGAPTFCRSSEWTVSVFTTEIGNKTGIDNLTAASLVRLILADQNPGDLWASPLDQCRIRFAGEEDGIVARDITFTAAYQGQYE